MLSRIKKSLHSKILTLVIGIMAVGVVISITWELRSREIELLDEKLRASEFIAKPVLGAIYEDMLEERADMARHLINTLSNVEGIQVHIIRSNGYEEAFQDLKTIEAVKEEFGEVKPEWLTDHPNKLINRYRAAESRKFQDAFSAFKEDWERGPIYYTEEIDGVPVFSYLQPIEKKAKCNTCHTAEGARGILMITTPLDEMYAIIARNRNQWIISGLIAVAAGGFLLSLLVKKSITGPIRRNVEVIKGIAEGGGNIKDRVDVVSSDEIGYLTRAFNGMLDAIEKRNEENERLFKMVAKSKEEWVATFDAIQDLISIHDRNNRILKVNRALARKLNTRPEDLIGRSCHEVFYGEAQPRPSCPHACTISTADISDAEVDDMKMEGTYKVTTFPIFNERGEAWASVHIARDITGETLLREQLLHAEKLSSMGKLVAGIAHELNNPLMGIMGFSQILMDTPGDKPVEEIKDKLQKISNEAMRTAKIVQNLLTFARAKKSEREYVSINDILKQTLELREYSLKANNIKVEAEYDPDLPKSMVDKYQLQQVFINIINNAEDAMVAYRGTGAIRVATSSARGRITVTISDDGPGIPKEIVRKVFDPFFTTKEVGKGTGLGLSITHGIITEHGGVIDIKSPEGGGACFTIDLPVVEQSQWAQVRKAVERVERLPDASRKSVLVTDDEESIRETLSGILTRQGFAVDTAKDGEEAMERLEKKSYSLVITDVKMPGIGGLELYNRISSKHPNLKGKVIFVTGDVFSSDLKAFFSKTGCPYFLKPFEPADLMNVINRVLAA